MKYDRIGQLKLKDMLSYLEELEDSGAVIIAVNRYNFENSPYYEIIYKIKI
jgi:hypothetical protein